MQVKCHECVHRQIFPVFQECTSLISRLCVEEGAGTELANKLTENLREIISDNKVRAALSVILMLIVDIIAKLALLMMTRYPLAEARRLSAQADTFLLIVSKLSSRVLWWTLFIQFKIMFIFCWWADCFIFWSSGCAGGSEVWNNWKREEHGEGDRGSEEGWTRPRERLGHPQHCAAVQPGHHQCKPTHCHTGGLLFGCASVSFWYEVRDAGQLGEYKTILSAPLVLLILQPCSFIHCTHTDLFIWLLYLIQILAIKRKTQPHAQHFSRAACTWSSLCFWLRTCGWLWERRSNCWRRWRKRGNCGGRETELSLLSCRRRRLSSAPSKSNWRKGWRYTPAAKQTSLKLLLLLSCGRKTRDIEMFLHGTHRSHALLNCWGSL